MNHLKHWDDVHEKHGLLLEFLEWLESGRGMPSGVRLEIGIDADDPKAFEPWKMDDLKPRALADRFLSVDRKELERERRELLQKCRAG